MCGIAGIVSWKDGARCDRALLEAMTDSLTHRGPDERGFFVDNGVGLGHRRLSIIDISSGQQPMPNATGKVVVCFNGEIYNFPDLTKELTEAGYRFKTHSDTEALLHAWEHWGEDCVNRLRGMFAFAIWDCERGTVFLARDRLGIKPLYYAWLDDDSLIFGSELKALMLHPGLSRDMDPQAVEEYFSFGYVPEPRTIFKQAKKLEPGATLSVRKGGSRERSASYWDIPFEPVKSNSESDVCEELYARMTEAVDIRMVAEVPLGAFLSGGVDSSAVVAAMAGLEDKPVNTCSIAFDQRQFDESDYANQIAAQFKTNHNVREVSSEDFSLLDKLSSLYDEPYADSSALPTYRVCELAKERVTVALSGDGGDENLAGYRRYKLHMMEERFRSAMPIGIRKPLFGTLGKLYPKLDWAPRVFRGKTTFQALARDSVAAYFHTVSIYNDELRAQLFSDSMKSQLQGYQAVEVLREHAARSPTDDPLSLVQYLDMKTYLVGDILTKVDRASMAHALEVRVPLLDHKFVEWTSGLPADMKLRGGEGKYIFKKSLESRLPHDVLYRPKMGFAVPLSHWFRNQLRDTIRSAVLGERLLDTGLFSEKFLHHLVEAHQSGRRDYSAPLWTLLMFDRFLENAMS